MQITSQPALHALHQDLSGPVSESAGRQNGPLLSGSSFSIAQQGAPGSPSMGFVEGTFKGKLPPGAPLETTETFRGESAERQASTPLTGLPFNATPRHPERLGAARITDAHREPTWPAHKVLSRE
jgi:hypothetical protein